MVQVFKEKKEESSKEDSSLNKKNQKDCIFCKIVSKDIPASVVYEDKKFISFLDIMPANKGHCLVIPKNHHETFLDMPDEELGELFKVGKKIAKALSLSIGNGAYNILMNNGREAGQVVNHAHLHIIPRFKDDRLRLSWRNQKYSKDEMKEYQDNIKKFL